MVNSINCLSHLSDIFFSLKWQVKIETVENFLVSSCQRSRHVIHLNQGKRMTEVKILFTNFDICLRKKIIFCDHLFESSHRDDSNEWSQNKVFMETKKVSIYFCLFRSEHSRPDLVSVTILCANDKLCTKCPATTLALSVLETLLCLCKQVGSRPPLSNSAAGLRSNLFAT